MIKSVDEFPNGESGIVSTATPEICAFQGPPWGLFLLDSCVSWENYEDDRDSATR